jgi:hypothetical protein
MVVNIEKFHNGPGCGETIFPVNGRWNLLLTEETIIYIWSIKFPGSSLDEQNWMESFTPRVNCLL